MNAVNTSAILTAFSAATQRKRLTGAQKAALCVALVEKAAGVVVDADTRAKMEELLWRDVTAVRIAQAAEVLRKTQA